LLKMALRWHIGIVAGDKSAACAQAEAENTLRRDAGAGYSTRRGVSCIMRRVQRSPSLVI